MTPSGMIAIRERAITDDQRQEIIGQLSWPNPAYVQLEKYGRWTGRTPRRLSLVEYGDGMMLVPRGSWKLLRTVLGDHGADAVSAERLECISQAIHTAPAIPLRDYQRKAAEQLIDEQEGVCVMPCGAGKSRTALAAIQQLGQQALIIVHTKDLMTQWQAVIQELLCLTPGQVGGGKHSIQPVTVAMVQTLARKSPTEIQQLGQQFGVVVCDEVHHISAKTFRGAMRYFGARYRWGLSATPERADGLTNMLYACIGPIVAQVFHSELVAAGHLVAPRIITYDTGVGMPSSIQRDDYAGMVSHLVAHEQRNAQIVELATGAARDGHACLVLSGRVVHCKALVEQLTAGGVVAKALTGKTPKAHRAATLDGFRGGTVQVVCATSLADEGLDVPRLSRVIIATPTRAESRTIQRLGRLMRSAPGKPSPVLYDLVDDIPMAKYQYYARARAYRKVLGCSSNNNGGRS